METLNDRQIIRYSQR